MVATIIVPNSERERRNCAKNRETERDRERERERERSNQNFRI
jgi:hypothetical protein